MVYPPALPGAIDMQALTGLFTTEPLPQIYALPNQIQIQFASLLAAHRSKHNQSTTKARLQNLPLMMVRIFL